MEKKPMTQMQKFFNFLKTVSTSDGKSVFDQSALIGVGGGRPFPRGDSATRGRKHASQKSRSNRRKAGRRA